jgi:hypothetical protein
MGDSCARGGKPGIKETGTPEDVPRTAAITHAAGIKKAPADVMGALLRLELHGFPHPVAELAATVGRVSCSPSLVQPSIEQYMTCRRQTDGAKTITF